MLVTYDETQNQKFIRETPFVKCFMHFFIRNGAPKNNGPVEPLALHTVHTLHIYKRKYTLY